MNLRALEYGRTFLKGTEHNICSRVVAATASLAGGAAHAGSIPGGCFPNPGSIPAVFLGAALGPQKNLVTLLDLCVSSLRRGHANLLCIIPILSDDLRGESKKNGFPISNEPSKKLEMQGCSRGTWLRDDTLAESRACSYS